MISIRKLVTREIAIHGSEYPAEFAAGVLFLHGSRPPPEWLVLASRPGYLLLTMELAKRRGLSMRFSLVHNQGGPAKLS